MPLNRSPAIKKLENVVSDQYSSNPELTTEYHDPELVKRKRKYTDDSLESILTNFTSKISSDLSFFKSGIEQSIAEVNNNIRLDLSALQTNTSDIKTEINALRSDFTKVKLEMSNLSAEQNILRTEVAEVKAAAQYISNQYEDLRNEIDSLKKENQSMRQHDRLLNLEVSGIPESDSEDLKRIICTIAELVDVNLSEKDIIAANRVHPRKVIPGRPKVVICKLASRLHKDSVIAGIRKRKGLKTGDIGFSGNSTDIYVNEHLTPYNRDLLKECRAIAREKGYTYVWVSNCKIYMREKQDAPKIHIYCTDDLKKVT